MLDFQTEKTLSMSRLTWFNGIARLLAVWVLALMAFAAAPALSAASRACAHLLAGTYLTQIVDSQGSLLSRSILTFQQGGTLLSLDSNQAGIATQFNPFTANSGEWTCAGRTSLAASTLSFTLPGSEGPEPGLARSDFQVRIDPRTRALEGTIELIFFPLSGDPLNGVGVSAGVFSFTAQPMVLGPR